MLTFAQRSSTLHKLIHNSTFLLIPNIHPVCITQPTQNPSYFWTYTNQNSSILLQFYSFMSCTGSIPVLLRMKTLCYIKILFWQHALPWNKVVLNTSLMGIPYFFLCWLLYTEILSPYHKRRDTLPDSCHVHLCT